MLASLTLTFVFLLRASVVLKRAWHYARLGVGCSRSGVLMRASLSARLIATFTGGALKVKRVTSSDDGNIEDNDGGDDTPGGGGGV